MKEKVQGILHFFLAKDIENRILAENTSFKSIEEIEFKIHDVLDTIYDLKDQQHELEKEVARNKLILNVLTEAKKRKQK
jgi:hypothetical protein